MLLALLKTMRPRQWTKNVFVLAAVVFDRQLTHPVALLHSIAGFILFCLASSAVYILNDIIDVEADRNHPKKRNRPIASGKLPIPVAMIAAIILLVVAYTLAYILSKGFFLIILVYLIVNLAYSTWLKHIPLIDVIVLASFYVMRVASGVTLIQVQRFSPWLYIVTTLFALYIGFGKRRAELSLLAGDANSHRRVLDGYTIPFLDQLITIVSSTTIIAYSLYTFTAPNLPDNHSMMLTIPFVIYGIFRYLYLVQVKEEGGAPEDLVLGDRPLQITVLLCGIAVMLIFYIY
jgi:4-hydroxybenzoate polyprenyltransferase